MTSCCWYHSEFPGRQSSSSKHELNKDKIAPQSRQWDFCGWEFSKICCLSFDMSKTCWWKESMAFASGNFVKCTMVNKNPEKDIGVQLKIRKAKQPATAELLPLWNPQTERERVPIFIFLSSAGIKGVHHYYLASMANKCGCWNSDVWHYCPAYMAD